MVATLLFLLIFGIIFKKLFISLTFKEKRDVVKQNKKIKNENDRKS